MILQNPIILFYDEGEFRFVREESHHTVHPADAAAKGFVCSPPAARAILQHLERAGVSLLPKVQEVTP